MSADTADKAQKKRTNKKLEQLLGSDVDAPKYRWQGDVLELSRALPVKQLACGGSGALMLLATGEVFRWSEAGFHPQKCEFRQDVENEPVEHRILKISAGEDHFCALSAEYSYNLYVWGGNAQGQLGLGQGDTKSRSRPTVLRTLDECVTSVSCGKYFTIAQTEFGHVYGWGSNSKGQLGQQQQHQQHQPLLAVTENSGKTSSGQDKLNSNQKKIEKDDTQGLLQEEEFKPAAVPDISTVNVDFAYSSIPVLINRLGLDARQQASEQSGDTSQGQKHLIIDAAHGEQAAAFTSVWSDTHTVGTVSRNEILRLKHIVSEKKSRVSDVQLRYKRTMARFRRHGGGGTSTNTSRNPFPSACSAAAELVDVHVQQEQEQGSVLRSLGVFRRDMPVIRDPVVSELDMRTAASQRQLEAESARMIKVRVDRDTTQAMLCEVQEAIQVCKLSLRELRERILAAEKVIRSQSLVLTSCKDLIESGFSKTTDVAKYDMVAQNLQRTLDDKAEKEQEVAELSLRRRALEERAAELHARHDSFNKEAASIERQVHQTQTRSCLYQRLRLRRQHRLQQEFAVKTKALWEIAAKAIHQIWQTYVLPADAIKFLQAQAQDQAQEEQISRETVRAAVQKSNALLRKARQVATNVLHDLRTKHARLEVKRDVKSQAWRHQKAGLVLEMPPTWLSFNSDDSQTPNELLFIPDSNDPDDKIKIFENKSLLVLEKVQHSAVIGEELVVDSVTVTLGGTRLVNFRSQALVAVLYQDVDGSPGQKIHGAQTEPARVLAQPTPQAVTLTFPTPVTLFTEATAKNLASFWVGLFLEKPNGVITVLGKPTLYHKQLAPSSLLVLVPESFKAPPEVMDIVPENQKVRGPLHLSLSVNVLSTCDRCERILQGTIRERELINSMLLSINSLNDILTF